MTLFETVRFFVLLAGGTVLGLFLFTLLCRIACRAFWRAKREFTVHFGNNEKGASNGKS